MLLKNAKELLEFTAGEEKQVEEVSDLGTYKTADPVVQLTWTWGFIMWLEEFKIIVASLPFQVY